MNQSTEPVDVFLCHTGANKDWVRNLAERLEGESVDCRQLRVFFDEWDIAPGENILSRVEHALDNARFLAVALSPALTHASWPTLEWQSQVYDDPSGRRGRIIPLIIEKVDPDTFEPLEIPLPLRILRYLDFSDPKKFEAQYQLLIARLRRQPYGRGRPVGLVDQMAAVNPSAGPDAANLVEEVVLGNLFPARLPKSIYSDYSSTNSYREVRTSFTSKFRTPFILNAGRLYSFVPLNNSDNPFRPFLTGAGVREERIDQFLNDSTGTRHLIWLCNAALRERCYALQIRIPPGRREPYYPVVFESQQRKFSWGTGKPLTLAKVSAGEHPLGVHHAASMRFIALGSFVHLLVQPRYFFTTDGLHPVDAKKASRYSVQWGNKEGNRTVLRRMLMWPRILSGGNKEISLETGGPEPVKVSTMPLHGRSTRGILGDTRDIESLLNGVTETEVIEDDQELDAVAAEHFGAELETDDGQFSGDSSISQDMEELNGDAKSATDVDLELPF